MDPVQYEAHKRQNSVYVGGNYTLKALHAQGVEDYAIQIFSSLKNHDFFKVATRQFFFLFFNSETAGTVFTATNINVHKKIKIKYSSSFFLLCFFLNKSRRSNIFVTIFPPLDQIGFHEKWVIETFHRDARMKSFSHLRYIFS